MRRAALAVASAAAACLLFAVASLDGLGAANPSHLATRTSPVTSGCGRSAALACAANAVGFHPITDQGVGLVDGQSAAQNAELLPVGTAAPSFRLKTPQGQTLNSSEYRGKAVLIEFFATWCPHCNAEAPRLRALDELLSPATYAVVSINADGETAPSVFAFERYYRLPYPALLDPSADPGSFNNGGSPGTVTDAYKVLGYPTFYVLDSSGRIAWRGEGEQSDARLRHELRVAARMGSGVRDAVRAR